MRLLRRLFINRDYGLLFVGRLVSQIGDGIHNFAIVWLVLDRTGSGIALSLLLIASTIPGILLTPFTGVLADRLDRKKIIIWMDVIRGFLLLLTAWIQALGMLTLPLIYLLTVLISLCGVLFGPAVLASMPSLVQREDLARANSRDIFATAATSVVGPVVGAFLLTATGYFGIFLINGISFLLSAFQESFIRIPKLDPDVLAMHREKEFMDNLRDGVRYVWHRHGLRLMLFAGFLLFCLFYPLFTVVLPFFGKEILRMPPSLFGIVQAGFPVGMLVGIGFSGLITRRWMKHHTMVVAMILQSLLVGILGLVAVPSLYESMPVNSLAGLLFTVLLLMGAMNVNIYVPFNVMVQETVPESLRGRVFSLFSSATNVAVPFGVAMVGVLIDLVPLQAVLLLCGTAGIAMAIRLGTSNGLRRLVLPASGDDGSPRG
jgi:MFS transporter, DHA3 family, macrolide efflux protein